METKYRHGLDHTYLILELPVLYEEDYQMKMMRMNRIEGLLMTEGQGVDGKSQYFYEIGGKVSLQSLYGKTEISAGELQELLIQILKVVNTVQKYMMDAGKILFEPEYIFYEEGKYFFCYLPGKTQELCESFHHMTEYFVKKLDYEDEQGITLAYELHKATLQENYDLYEIIQEYREEYEAENEEEILEETQEWEEQEDTFSDMAFQLESEEDYEPMKDTEVIKESGGVWSAWKKAAHKIGRGRLGRWGSWDDLILETDGQDESSHL